MSENKPIQIEEVELWQLRALDAQEGRIKAELELLKRSLMEVQEEMKKFSDKLHNRYGEKIRIYPDGKITYENAPLRGVPGLPTVPETPETEGGVEDKDEEE